MYIYLLKLPLSSQNSIPTNPKPFFQSE
jgi:hypothetical protein